MFAKVFGIAAVAATMLACGGDTGGSTTPPATVLSATATVGGTSKTILTDNKGMTLYLFTPDKGGKVTCTGGCLAVWPALISNSPTAGAGVTGTLTTVANPDGKGQQVVYNGWPLYYYVKDTKPGDVTGQNVGAKWFVVPPDITP
jgi:predicted lipoprotein with Yx(FWY)xxD motif